MSEVTAQSRASAEQAGEFATYQEAMDFLLAMVDYEKLSSFKYTLPNFDLRRTRQLLASAGDPQDRLRMAHIAGTKGKGSTAMMLAAILTRCGWRTGLFTSPHLVHLEERVTIDGRMMGKDDVRRILGRLRPYVESLRTRAPEESPTFFELVTALGFSYFAEQKAEFGVIEVGMGGRLDSTNVIHPLVCVITHLDLDHVKRLGPTLERIAWEKAGIIKPGIPVICAPQRPEALAVVERACSERGAPLHLLGRDSRLTDVDTRIVDGAARCLFSLETPTRAYHRISMPLLGRHQAFNAALAIRSAELLEERAGLKFSEEIARNALTAVRCPARIEVISGRPMRILDGAHNVAAMAALKEVIEENPVGKRRIFVFGVARDKDVDGMLRQLAAVADEVVFTKSDSPRAFEPAELLEIMRQLAPEMAMSATDDAAAALDHAMKRAGDDDVVCITGSLYLAGKLRPLLMPEEY